MLADRGVKDIKMYDLSYTHYSKVLSECFKYSNLVFGTTTYNGGIFESMQNFLHILTDHNLQNRKISLVENGSWAPVCGGQMKKLLEGLKGTEFLEPGLCIKSTLKDSQIDELENVVNTIVNSLGL